MRAFTKEAEGWQVGPPNARLTGLLGGVPQHTGSANSGAGTALFEVLSQGVTDVVPALAGYITLQQSIPGTPGFRVTVNP